MAPGEHDDDFEESAHRDPLPRDDRLWRHPSELDELTEADADAERTLLARLQGFEGA